MERALIFLGDIHLEYSAKKLIHAIKIRGIENSDIVQVGDFGLGYQSIEKDRLMLAELNIFLKKKNCTVSAIRGNHDDPKIFNGENLGFSNITLVSDNSILELCGKKVLMIGGAVSVDRYRLTEGENYWKDEVFVFDKEALDNLNLSEVDIVCTHSSPNFAHPIAFSTFVYDCADKDAGLLRDLEIERSLIAEFYEYVKPKMPKLTHYFYGHFHQKFGESIEGVYFRLLGEDEYYEFR